MRMVGDKLKCMTHENKGGGGGGGERHTHRKGKKGENGN
jgi:hypothetical protein